MRCVACGGEKFEDLIIMDGAEVIVCQNCDMPVAPHGDVQCPVCLVRFPVGLVSLFTTPGLIQLACPMCSLRMRNEIHGLPAGTPFTGETALRFHAAATRWVDLRVEVCELTLELERRCPGCYFTVDFPRRRINITEFGRMLSVDMDKAEMSLPSWFKMEIEKRPEPGSDATDEAYWVICPGCGEVRIGHHNYAMQMTRPDLKWRCPLCGRDAMFDDAKYEKFFEEGINGQG